MTEVQTNTNIPSATTVEEHDPANNSTMSTHSPTISSISSIETTHSTEKLIDSLAATNLTDTVNDNNNNNTNNMVIKQIDPETLNSKFPKSVASKTNFYNDLSQSDIVVSPTSPTSNNSGSGSLPLPKKAIKFTVRKVSHETILSPKSSPSISSSHPKFSPSSSSSSSNRPPSTSSAQFKNKSSSIMAQGNDKEREDLAKLEKAQRKYEDYDYRIIKIDKEINFLTRLLPPYNVEVDYNTRVKITKAIEKLRMKQDEIDKKKYDLGITISRLWRNLDEGRDIWVRKVD
ncbi:hypothetical protein G210_4355, partial [Candida maltosa Xu316]